MTNEHLLISSARMIVREDGFEAARKVCLSELGALRYGKARAQIDIENKIWRQFKIIRSIVKTQQRNHSLGAKSYFDVMEKIEKDFKVLVELDYEKTLLELLCPVFDIFEGSEGAGFEK